MDEIIVWVRQDVDNFLFLTELETISFHNPFMAYEVEITDNRAVVLRHDIPWHGVSHIVQENGKKFIVEKDTSCIEDTLQRKSFFDFTFWHCLHAYRA